MIVTDGLTKIYGQTTALSNVCLEVRKGEVYGLLGPNGSGKTTAIRLLLGLIRPTAGRASVAGFDCWTQSVAVRELVSYIPGEIRLIGSMNGYLMLKYLSDLRGGESLERAVSIAEKVMKLDLGRKIRAYSTGMKQKLAIAQAFADPVDILILDEPTSALDPSARNDVIQLVKAARATGQTVIFSGHVLPEVEAVADRVAIMRKGRLMHVEDMHERRSSARILLLRFSGQPPTSFPENLDLSIREVQGNVLLVEHRGEVRTLLEWLATQPIDDMAVGTDDLRSLYDRYHGPNVDDLALDALQDSTSNTDNAAPRAF